MSPWEPASDLSKPTTNALLHSGVWILYQYQSENLLPVEAKKEHFAPYEQEILLLRLCVILPHQKLSSLIVAVTESRRQLSNDCPVAISQFCVALSSGVL